MYYDAEDGPMFWEEETWQDVQKLAAQVISGSNDGVPMDSARTSISVGDMFITQDCSQKQIKDIANQLRDVIKVKSNHAQHFFVSSSFPYLKIITILLSRSHAEHWLPEIAFLPETLTACELFCNLHL